MLIKEGSKNLYNLGKYGLSRAIKSYLAKHKMKNIAHKYVDQALENFTSDLSKKLNPYNKK